MQSLRWLAAVLPLSLAVTLGCVQDDASDDLEDEMVGEAEDALSPFDWSDPSAVGQGAYLGAALGTLDGKTYMVRSGDCVGCTQLYWSRLNANGTWSTAIQIPNQRSSEAVSLAAFNGYLYMVHLGESSSSKEVWASRFNPATQQWSTNYMLPYASERTPAIAAYHGRLQLVGEGADGRPWNANIDASGTLSARSIMDHWIDYRPSLAVVEDRLYLALAGWNRVSLMKYDGTSWTHTRTAYEGYYESEPREPVLAAHDGYLHLVHKRRDSDTLWWSSFDGSEWSTPVTLGTMSSTARPAMTEGGSGLVLATTSTCHWMYCAPRYPLRTAQYTSPASGPAAPPDVVNAQ